jgi:DNA invertase Pin-like site-specific DNA recombinase
LVVGKGKITAGQMRSQLEEIAKKPSAGYTDREIMKDLKIPRSTFYRYKAKIITVYLEIWQQRRQKKS